MKKSNYIGLMIAVLILLGGTGIAQSGTIYYDLASYDAVTDGILWEEDFYYDGFQGEIPWNPAPIAGGQAELVGTGLTSILFPAASEYVSQGATLIQGVGVTDLGVSAISFNFTYYMTDQSVDFNLVGGGTPDESTTNHFTLNPFGLPSGATYFMGWVGDPGELLSNVSFADGVILDNIQASQPVPVPAAVWLLGTGFLSLTGLRKKLKR